MARQKDAATSRPKRKDGRLGAWLTKAEVRAFKDYAAQLRVPDSALALFLILRELRLHRLAELNGYRASVSSGERDYITATRPGDQAIDELRAHLDDVGETVNGALALLFRAELAERWLDQALGTASSEESG